MKFCYCDETGMRNGDRLFIGVGIVIDAARLNRTNEAFAEIFEKVQLLFPEELKELKASKLLLGGDRWRKINPSVRKIICESLCNWICHRKHDLVLTAIDHDQYSKLQGNAPMELQRHYWLAGMTHLALQVQKLHQNERNNKGRTVLLIDDNKQFADAFAEILWNPPSWTDSYYDRGKKQEPLDQIIDSAFAVKSHHAGMVQIADLFAFLFRRYAEMRDYASPAEWDGEGEYVERLVCTLSKRLPPASARWPKRTTSACAQWFNQLAPQSLRDTLK